MEKYYQCQRLGELSFVRNLTTPVSGILKDSETTIELERPRKKGPDGKVAEVRGERFLSSKCHFLTSWSDGNLSRKCHEDAIFCPSNDNG